MNRIIISGFFLGISATFIFIGIIFMFLGLWMNVNKMICL
jgi:hypothetical protein